MVTGVSHRDDVRECALKKEEGVGDLMRTVSATRREGVADGEEEGGDAVRALTVLW